MIIRIRNWTILAAFAVACGGCATNQEVRAIRDQQAVLEEQVQDIQKKLAAALPAARRSPVEDVDFEVTLGEDRPVRGSPNARVMLIEFSDFQCPYCVRHVKLTAPNIEKDYMDTGKIRYAFFEMPLVMHPKAAKAAEAAECAREQGKFWEMHDRLYADPMHVDETNLVANASALGLDGAKFRQCLDTGKTVAAINEDKATAARLTITGTPSFALGFVEPGNHKVKVVKLIRGAFPYTLFQETIDGLLAKPR